MEAKRVLTAPIRHCGFRQPAAAATQIRHSIVFKNPKPRGAILFDPGAIEAFTCPYKLPFVALGLTLLAIRRIEQRGARNCRGHASQSLWVISIEAGVTSIETSLAR